MEDLLPKESKPIFENLASVRKREGELTPPTNLKSRYSVIFTDKNFRKFTASTLSSNDIFQLLRETSQVEFKLVFPVRLKDKNQASQEHFYTMTIYSRLFEFGYVDQAKRKDGIVKYREYTAFFNTILGELFAHNLLAKNYDWVDAAFYKLFQAAQLFYRKFLLHNDFKTMPISLENISAKLNYRDHNETNLPKTVEQSILEPLKDFGLISSYEKEEGLAGLKYVVHRNSRLPSICENTGDSESGVCKTYIEGL